MSRPFDGSLWYSKKELFLVAGLPGSCREGYGGLWCARVWRGCMVTCHSVRGTAALEPDKPHPHTHTLAWTGWLPGWLMDKFTWWTVRSELLTRASTVTKGKRNATLCWMDLGQMMPSCCCQAQTEARTHTSTYKDTTNTQIHFIDNKVKLNPSSHVTLRVLEKERTLFFFCFVFIILLHSCQTSKLRKKANYCFFLFQSICKCITGFVFMQMKCIFSAAL